MPNKPYLKYFLLTVTLIVTTTSGFFLGQKQVNNVVSGSNVATTTVSESPTSIVVTAPTYITYTNEKYGYKVEYEKQPEAENNIMITSVPEEGYDIFSFDRYTEEYGDQPLGEIYCTDTFHKNGIYKDVVGLSANMDLEEYANTIYRDKINRGIASVQQVKPARGGMGLGTFAELEAFDFIVAEISFRPSHYPEPLEVNRYIVTESPQNQRCVIRYSEFDYSQEDSTDMYIARQHWVNSFRWMGVMGVN